LIILIIFGEKFNLRNSSFTESENT
jgi:hypothetical protein